MAESNCVDAHVKVVYHSSGSAPSIDGYWYYDGSTVYIQFGRIMGGHGSYYEQCRFKGEFEDGKATIFGGKFSAWSSDYSEEWVFSDNSIIVDGGRYVWKR